MVGAGGVDVAVIAMLAPTLAVQGLAQGAPASVIETLPRPAVAAAVIATVAAAKLAVALTLALWLNVHGWRWRCVGAVTWPNWRGGSRTGR